MKKMLSILIVSLVFAIAIVSSVLPNAHLKLTSWITIPTYGKIASPQFQLEPLIEGPMDDHSPYIFQDFTNKIWIFFISVGRIDTLGDNRHLFYITSVDRGITWSDPTLFQPAYVPGLTVQYPIAFQDSNGRIWVAWLNHTAPHNADQIWFSTSDDGENWTPAKQLCDGHNDTGFAFIEVAGKVWLVFSRGASALCYKTTDDGGENWSNPVPINTWSGRSPNAIVLANGTIFVVFHHYPHRRITCLTSSDKGLTWRSGIVDDPPDPEWDAFARAVECCERVYVFFRRSVHVDGVFQQTDILFRVWNKTKWETSQQATDDVNAGWPTPFCTGNQVWFTFDIATFPRYDIWLARSMFMVTAAIDVDPNTLNLNSNGQWITVRLTLSEGYNVGDIDPDTVKIDDVPLAWSEIQNGAFIAKFDRASVQRTLTGLPDYEEGTKFQDLILTVTGQLNNGQLFEGSDTIKVITK